MNSRARRIINRLLIGCAIASWPLLLVATPPGADGKGPGGCESGSQGGPPRHSGEPMGPGFGAFGVEHDFGGPPPFLMGLRLSEEQQDKVFAIVHAAAPGLRDQSKLVHNARNALHEMVHSTPYSESSAAALAQTQGRADAQLTLLRTRMEHDVYSVLTPDQQAQTDAHGHDPFAHPGPGEPPPPRR